MPGDKPEDMAAEDTLEEDTEGIEAAGQGTDKAEEASDTEGKQEQPSASSIH